MSSKVKQIFLMVVLGFLTFPNMNGQAEPLSFGGESPWEQSNQQEETMDKQTLLQASDIKKANNRGGQGGAGGFATFNKNTKDVPIDNGLLVVAIFFLGFGIYQIKIRQSLGNKLNLRDN
jgi:hypothetical protein